MHNLCAFPCIFPDLLLSFVISFKTRFYKPASTKVWYIQRNALNWIGGSTNQYVHEGIFFKKAFTIKRLILPPNYFTWILFSEKKPGVFFCFVFYRKQSILTCMSAVLCVTSYRLRKNGKFRLRPKERMDHRGGKTRDQ